MSNTPLIYSELLFNIRQISVIVALDTLCNTSTKVELSVDSQQFILSHDGRKTTLDLPGQVAFGAQLQKPAVGSKELSWRLPLATQSPRASEDAQSNEAPWAASSLAEDAEFSCRDCGAVVVKQGAIKTWKDLPSENWAEMMDFWHCHKPDVPHTHGSSDQPPVPDKGYSPNSRFAAQPGLGFVDLTTLLLSGTDCLGTQSSPPQTSEASNKPSALVYQPIVCTSCTNYLGYHDPQSEGIRLYKWRLSLSTSPSHNLSALAAPTKPSLANILSAHLLSVVQSQCVSRILVMPHPSPSTSPSNATNTTINPPTPASKTAEAETETEPKVLSLWIFAPTLRFSFSSSSSSSSSSLLTTTNTATTPSKKGTLATKIFHQSLSLSTAATLLQKGNIEEIYLPTPAISELEIVLRESGDFLPPSARKFQVWDVGLLERYEVLRYES